MNHIQMKEKIRIILENIQKVIVGKRHTIEKVLSCLLAEGHVLIEDLPGTGKTVLAKALAKSCETSFSRIQFTPDLLPTDVTGVNMYHRKTEEFVFVPGPVFANVVLADEINRATPRTQAGLLECMEERQVTTDGTTRDLERPFFVIATQNPVETAGTFPLPEAQLDRFTMKLSVGYPDKEEEASILERFAQDTPLHSLGAVATKEDLLELIACAKQVYVHPALYQYGAALAEYTRKSEHILSGISTRALLGMFACARAYALIRGRNFVTPDDIKEIAADCLAHRLISATDTDGEKMIVEALQRVPVPTEVWETE